MSKNFSFKQVQDKDIVKTQKEVTALKADLTNFWKNKISASSFGANYIDGIKNVLLIGNISLFLPKGDYYFANNQIWLENNIEIYGEEGTVIHTSLASKGTFIYATNKSNINIHNIEIIADNPTVLLLHAKGCTNIKMYDVKSTNVSLLRTDTNLTLDFLLDDPVEKGYVNETYGCKNVKVFDCEANGGNITEIVNDVLQYTSIATNVYNTAISGIDIRFCVDAEIYSNKITGFRHGIMYWGANSSLYGNDLNYPRLCKRIKIRDNDIKNVLMGGIWGAMGEDIQIYNNHVEGCYDVGIDFEATTTGIATGNTIKNCSLGCLATFYACKDILFANNTCLQDGVWTQSDLTSIAINLYFHSNGSNTTNNGAWDITLQNNKFKFLAKGVVAVGADHLLGRIYTTNCWQIIMDNNELENVIIAHPSSNTLGSRIITNNKILLKYAAWTAFSAINITNTYGTDVSNWGSTKAYTVGQIVTRSNRVYKCTTAGTTSSTAPSHSEGSATDGTVTWLYIAPLSDYYTPRLSIISDNTIVSLVEQPTGSYGINCVQNWYNGTITSLIENNKISNFSDSIRVKDEGGNAGYSQIFVIKNNTITGDIINDTVIYPEKGLWVLDNNKNFEGKTIPNTIPLTGIHPIGQNIKYVPTSAGKIGTACITRGYYCSTNWQATTAYVLGVRVFANNKVYQCTIAGTTSSTAPSHSTGTAIDGTVTWAYVGALAIFKEYGDYAS